MTPSKALAPGASLSCPKMLTAPQIRQNLDNLAVKAQEQGRVLTPYQQQFLTELIDRWQRMKPQLPPAYHPIIDDRIALCQVYVNNSRSIPHG